MPPRAGVRRTAGERWRLLEGVPVVRAVGGRLLRRLAGLQRRWHLSRRRLVEFGIRPWLLRGRVVRVSGPAVLQASADELVLTCVVRNGALYVRSFMTHYRALGVRHFVFLDNGSSDDTRERLREYPEVTLLASDVPYAEYENTMKRYLAEHFAPGRWTLSVDIDELFDYPGSSSLSLQGLLGYLDAHGFTVVVAQMLDLFADVPFAEVRSRPEDLIWEAHRYYDLTAIDRPPYEWADPPRAELRMHWGGIRRVLFGTGNGLTKAALFRMDGRVKPFVQWHHVTGGHVADVSCVLRHYPFVSTFCEKVRDAVETGRYGVTTTGEYQAYAAALARDPALSPMRPTARLFDGLEPLVADGFLVASPAYRAWVARHGAVSGRADHGEAGSRL